MKVGDLVWHVEDLKDGVLVPGLIVETSIHEGEVTVFFGDRTFNEYHTIDELTLDPFTYEWE